MEWTEDDIITVNKYQEAFPDAYHKTDVFYTSEAVQWRGRLYHRPPPTTPFIVSGHSDYTVTDRHVSLYPRTVWFGVNMSASTGHGLPIGIIPDDPDLPVTAVLGNLAVLCEVSRTPRQIRNLAYMNFSIETYPQERQPVWDRFHTQPWVTCGTMVATLEGRREFLAELRAHAFVLCPRGNGVETSRIWETLYMGSIPVVLQDPVHKDWQDLPIVFVSSWSDVTEDFLLAKQREFASRTWSLEKLKVGYWINRMRASAGKPNWIRYAARAGAQAFAHRLNKTEVR